MYRLWSAKWSSAQNIRLVLSKCSVLKHFTDGAFKCQSVNFNYAQAPYSQLHQRLDAVTRLPVSVTTKFNETTIVKLPVVRVKPCAMPSVRHQSTISAKALRKRKRRFQKPRYSKYVELLEVTDIAANERKSRVRSLKAKKLQDFISTTQTQGLEQRAKDGLVIATTSATTGVVSTQSTEEHAEPSFKKHHLDYTPVNIEELDSSILESGIYDDKPMLFFGNEEYTKHVISNSEQVNDILKSFNNYRDIIESMGNETQEPHSIIDTFSLPHEKMGTNETLLDSLETADAYLTPDIIAESAKKTKTEKVVSASTAKSKQRFKSNVHNNEEQQRLAKERSLRINLESYLNVCVTAGMVNRGVSTLLAYRSRAKKNPQTKDLVTIDLYNIVLHGFAEKGSFERFKDVFVLIKEDGLVFNEQTFAAIFECLGRVEESAENLKLINKYAKKASNMGFTLNSIFDCSKFTMDQRDIALDAVRRMEPKFTPVYTPPDLNYNNTLLNRLNEYVLPADVKASELKSEGGAEIMNSKRGFSKKRLQGMAREQLKIELNGCVTIKSIEKSKGFQNADYCRVKLKELEEAWRTQISSAILRDLNILRAQLRLKPNSYMTYFIYLKALDSPHFVDILIKEIYKLAEGSETFSPTVGHLHRELGHKVQQRYQIETKKKNGILEKVGELYSSYCGLWHEANTSDNTRQMWQRLVHEHRENGPSMDIKEANWSSNVLTGIGKFLYNILMRDIKIDTHIMRQKGKSKQQNLLPAFYTLFRTQGRMVKEEVKPHPVLARLLRASRQQTLTFDSNLVPMLCPPQPWSTPYNGGYLINKSELIRLPHQAIQQWDRINETNPQNLYPALDSLNQLASVPWRVNKDLLDVIIEVFQNGGDDKLDVPRPPSSLPPLPSIPKENTLSPAERAKIFKEKLARRRKQSEMYSLWCDTLYRLSLANHYRNQVFWLPHNMDFRGRVYPVPPHLNHLGSDLARSMLIFDQAQPLGPDGFSWLKLHCINLTGSKKRDSVHERLLYAEEIMDDILDSAKNPLTGRMWWAKSDEPWQTLACCIEIAKVSRSPNPAAYLSRFPIHQDGSCNGLQHYAALGRDNAGAINVNLAPAPIPQDVYSGIATLVEKARKVDAQNGLQVAEILKGFVQRKVIKQTVMTTVYGVTRYGARLQIARQLKDLDDFPKEWVWPASTYLTGKTFESLREMFTSTREIQDWFTECARLISGVCGQNVEWITPLGLPVVQPYNRQEVKPILRKDSRVSETMPMDMYERPNVMKQKNAFPPNFIHSLDSSHMMLTSLHCERNGLTFVSVHDCFWTHARTVPDMNRICREQFVALHSQAILEDLSDFMKRKYSFKENDFSNDGSVEDLAKRRLNRALRQMPEKGDFDLQKVLKSIYFFS